MSEYNLMHKQVLFILRKEETAIKNEFLIC
jgi:hypothetical protein